MASKRVLLLGGHGKVSLLLTPQLVSRSCHVTSVIRDPSQKQDILATTHDRNELLDVMITSLEGVKSQADAQKVIEQSNANCVIWSAGKSGSSRHMCIMSDPDAYPGAGGKGEPSRTQAVDRDSCIHFIQAAASTPSVTKFILISYLGSRRNKAPWWSDDEWAATQEVNQGALQNYYPAKLASDESLTAAAGRCNHLQAIVLRPGSLTDDEAKGTVSFGRTRARGSVTRGDVAAVAAQLVDLDIKAPVRWLDLLEGKEHIEEAVRRVVEEDVNCIEGEDMVGLERSLTDET